MELRRLTLNRPSWCWTTTISWVVRWPRYLLFVLFGLFMNQIEGVRGFQCSTSATLSPYQSLIGNCRRIFFMGVQSHYGNKMIAMVWVLSIYAFPRYDLLYAGKENNKGTPWLRKSSFLAFSLPLSIFLLSITIALADTHVQYIYVFFFSPLPFFFLPLL